MRLFDFHTETMAWAGGLVRLAVARPAAVTSIGWTAGEVVDHLAAVGCLCAGSAAGVAPDALPPADPEVDRLVAWQAAAGSFSTAFEPGGSVLERVMPTPVGLHPGATVLLVGTLEHLVHGLDLVPAVAPGAAPPDGLATEALARLVAHLDLLTEFRRLGYYGPSVPVGPDAGAAHRLAAFLGRTPSSMQEA